MGKRRSLGAAAPYSAYRGLVRHVESQSDRALASDLTAATAADVQLRRIIDTIPVLAWCNLPDGSNEFLNQQWQHYTGLSQEEGCGWGWKVAFHPEDLPPLLDRWRQLSASGEAGEIEARDVPELFARGSRIASDHVLEQQRNIGRAVTQGGKRIGKTFKR